MAEEDIPLLERINKCYDQLSSVAEDLNLATGQLTKSVNDIDAAIKKLNLGISTWLTIASGPHIVLQGSPTSWMRELGYAKVDGKWGICIRKTEWTIGDANDRKTEMWLFNDAPRGLRLEATSKIPELLEQISADAAKTAKAVHSRLEAVQTVAHALKRDTSPRSSPARIQSPSASISLGDLTKRIVDALKEAGHFSAAQLLGNGIWTMDTEAVRVQVPGTGKKMLSLTVNAAAEKLVREQLGKLGCPPRLLVTPEETVQAAPEVK